MLRVHVIKFRVNDVSKILEMPYFLIWSIHCIYCKVALTTSVVMNTTEVRASVSVALLVSCTVLAGGK